MGEKEGLAKKLKTLRESRGWSQGQLAMQSGVTRSHISVIELGKIKNPRSDILIKLAQALRVPVDEFFRAAGYLAKEDKATYNHNESPERLLENIEADVRRVKRILDERKGEKK